MARVDALGTRLEYAGYLGGDGGADIGHAIAVDGNGSAYVVGATDSSAGLPAVGGFRTQTNARDTDASDGFAARISEDGRSLVYFTLLTGAAPVRTGPWP